MGSKGDRRHRKYEVNPSKQITESISFEERRKSSPFPLYVLVILSFIFEVTT